MKGEMKQIFLSVLFAAIAAFSVRGAGNELFPYPVPPEEMTTLNERCDYLVSHFWERCDLKAAQSTKERLHNCFGDWVSFMPYAHADTVHSTINRILNNNRKKGQIILALARMAEAWTYSDTTSIFSEEIYYPFAKAAAECKKIDKVDRMRYAMHAQIIENSKLGGTMKYLEYEKPDGSNGSIADVRTQMIVVLFSNDDCDECALARVRLSANLDANALIKAGLLTVMYIETTGPTDSWKAAASSYPENWVIGAMSDADEYFRLDRYPTIYLVDSRHKILAKDFTFDGLLRAISTMRANSGI